MGVTRLELDGKLSTQTKLDPKLKNSSAIWNVTRNDVVALCGTDDKGQYSVVALTFNRKEAEAPDSSRPEDRAGNHLDPAAMGFLAECNQRHRPLARCLRPGNIHVDGFRVRPERAFHNPETGRRA